MEENVKGLKTFGLVSVIVIAVLVVAFVSLFLLISGDQQKNPFDFPNEAQALASVLALVFGTAATAGGAIAAIRVAALGFEIAERQDHIDRTRFIETKVTHSVDCFSNLLIALGNAYAALIVVNHKIPHLDKERIVEQMSDDAPIEVSVEMEALAERLSEIGNAINRIARDEFTYFCFRKSEARIQSKISHLNRSLLPFGVQESALTLSINQLSDISAMLDIAARKLRTGNLGDLIQARVYTVSSDIDLFGVEYNNKAVRDFMFMGNLTCATSDHNAKDGRVYIASFGAAIFHDLVRAVPNGKMIAECIKERYPIVSEQLPIQDNIFDPETIASGSLLTAIKDVDAIGDLYLLKGTNEQH